MLVTGAAGFIGSQLSRFAARLGHEVIGVDAFDSLLYPASVKQANALALSQVAGITFHEFDLRGPMPAAYWDGIDCVINQAAVPGLAPSWTDFDAYLAANTLIVERLARGALEAGVSHFVHISTSSVYGREAACSEDSPLRPNSPYGVSKLAGETLLQAYASNFGLPLTVLRYFSVYGPGQRPDMAYHLFAERMLAGEPITVFGNGHQSRSNTHVTDCIRATLAAVDHAPAGQTYNIAGGEVVDLLEAISVLADALGVEPVLRFEEERPGDQLRTKGDWSKAARVLGYAPRVPVREGLREQAEWHRLGRPAEFVSEWGTP